MKKECFDYTVYVTGLFGRNRKVKTEGFDLFIEVETPPTYQQLKEKLETVLKDRVKPKGQFSFRVVELPVTLEELDGVTFKTHVIQYGKGTVFQETRN